MKALIIGATGLVGRHTARLLLDDPSVESVAVFVRRPTGLDSPKLTEHTVDYDALDDWRGLLVGDVLFSSLGTTRKKAGSKEAQYRVDYTYQHDIAKAAADNGVKTLVLVSSAGADASSSMFYSRIKGELEEAAQKMGFESVCAVQPSVLVGERDHSRPGEALGVVLGRFAAKILPPVRKWRPIEGETVAKALIALAKSPPAGFSVHALEDVHTLAG